MSQNVFRFENPQAFYYFFSLAVLLMAYFLYDRNRKKLLEKFFAQKSLPLLTESVSLFRRKIKRVLQLLILALFILAWARPQNGKSEQKVKSEGVEIMFLVDVSNSMLTEDVKPSRLELAKKELQKFIDYSTGDKMGLVAFAGSAILLSPMTQDKAALKMYVDSLSTESVSTQGTVFEKALLEAKEAFKRGGVEEDEKSVVTRVVIIVSDGEDNEPGALKAADQLLKEGIRIFSLAVGTKKGGPIPIRNQRGELIGHRKDKKNRTILSRTKGALLKKLAQKGKGSFYHLSFGSQTMKKVSQDIKKLETTVFDSATVAQYNERYQPILFLAILLLFLEIFLGERNPKGRIWKGRFEVMEQ